MGGVQYRVPRGVTPPREPPTDLGGSEVTHLENCTEPASRAILHSVTQSAVSTREGRQRATARRITRCAQELAQDRGLDGFTMDELAEQAGVSRRTLYGYFPGKVDAVLGPFSAPPPAAVEVFRAGGPHGDLVEDLAELVRALLATEEVEVGDLARLRALMAATPKLLAAMHERFTRLSEEIVAAVADREGPGFDRRRARVAVAVLIAVFDVAFEELLDARGGRLLPDHFSTTLRTARALFA